MLLAAPRLAGAGPVVLAVDDGTVLIDLGAGDGVGAGAVLELLHEVVVRDPVTGEKLRDVFAIGELTVIRAGDGIAEARPDADVAKRVRVGDEVRLVSDARRFWDPWVIRVAESKPTAPVVAVIPEWEEVEPDDEPVQDAAEEAERQAARRAAAERRVADSAEVRSVWRETLGRAIADRITRWEELLLRDADNLYAAAVRTEIESLRAQQVAIDAAIATPPVDRAVELADALAGLDERVRTTSPVVAATLTRARLGEPIELAFAVRDPDIAQRGWLYARKVGDEGFQKLELRAEGDLYLRGEIPAALVAPPGVEWFVEVASAAGAPDAAIGSDATPELIEVYDTREPEAAPRGRSRITTSLEYVDFDGGLRGGFDQYTQAELDFMYRFHKPVYALRLGFGTLTGTGGPKDVIDEDPTDQCLDETGAYRCRQVTFTYGYIETEHKIRPNISLMLRPQIGRLTTASTNQIDPADCLEGSIEPECNVGKGYGFRARVRFGEESATNLVVGVAATGKVGTVLEAAYNWLPKPQVPIVVAVQVTDLPVTENLGVRIVGDVGWRRASWVYPTLRLSYQARDVDHAGFSGGLGLNFDW